MAAALIPLLTPEDYLRQERQADFRSEFVNGQVYAMSGGSRVHSVLIAAFAYELNSLLGDRPCLVTVSDLRLQIGLQSAYVYPDVMVTCGALQPADWQNDTARRTSTTYDDQTRTVTARRDVTSINDGALVEVSRFDMLGNLRWSQRTSDTAIASSFDPNSGIKTQIRSYVVPCADPCPSPGPTVGRYSFVSNPYSSLADPTMGWTRNRYDSSGRLIETASFSGATLPAPIPGGTNSNTTGVRSYSYPAATVATTDEAGRLTASYFDSLGRLTGVVQNNGSQTDYLYNGLDNLTQVTQRSLSGGLTSIQKRILEYDSRSLLRRVWQPETSPDRPDDPSNPTVTSNRPTVFTYDGVGNLVTKTDARGVTGTFGYDQLQRLKTKTYNDGTPSVALN